MSSEQEQEAGKGTEYVVLCKEMPDGSWHQIPPQSTFTTESKEAAIRAAFIGSANISDDAEYKAVPMSSWRESFEIDPDPRVRRKK